MTKVKVFDRVSFRGSVEVQAEEHELFLSFLDDSGSYAFSDWWGEDGSRLFAKWVGKQKGLKGLYEALGKKDAG